jgi:hypothetical protein
MFIGTYIEPSSNFVFTSNLPLFCYGNSYLRISVIMQMAMIHVQFYAYYAAKASGFDAIMVLN